MAEGVIRTGRPTDTVKTDRARALRKDMTRAERILWAALRGKRLDGLRFRRQEPIAGFIVDFICVARRLVVELDGAVHATPQAQAYDAERDAILTGHGLRVLRLPNALVERDLPAALERIAAACAGQTPTAPATPPHSFPSQGSQGQGSVAIQESRPALAPRPGPSPLRGRWPEAGWGRGGALPCLPAVPRVRAYPHVSGCGAARRRGTLSPTRLRRLRARGWDGARLAGDAAIGMVRSGQRRSLRSP